METTAELKHLLKALRLSPLLSTLPERVAYAKGSKLTHLEFLELLLSDEVERRAQGTLQRRLQSARVDHDQVLERFDWESKVSLDRDRLRGLIGLEWIERRENLKLFHPCCGHKNLPTHPAKKTKQSPLRTYGRHQKTQAFQGHKKPLWGGIFRTSAST